MNREQMTAPFAEEEIRQFEGRGGKTMTYIEDETVMDRLDVGYGYGNWQLQVDALTETVNDRDRDGIIVGTHLAPLVKVRLGVRDHGEWAWYEDFGYPNREGGESLKEAVSDGIRRCGRFVGIARDLYRKATYEPGGSRAPSRPHADASSSPNGAPNGEHGDVEEMLGRVRRRGIIKKGTATEYKLDARQGPDGHVFGFRLEIDGDKNIPQCLAAGPLGEAVFVITGGKPETLVGTIATVAGILYNVKRPDKPGSWYRLHVDLIETDEWIVPAPSAEKLPEPPPDVALVGERPEAPTAPLAESIA